MLARIATDLIEQSGSDALSLREVARHAGVSSAAPYRHYASKEALLAEVATQGFEQLRADLVKVAAGLDLRQGLLARCVVYVGFAEGHPALYRLMFGAFPNKDDYGGLIAAGDHLFTLLNDALPGASSDQPARAVGCWAFLHGLAILALDDALGRHLAGERDAMLLTVIEPYVDMLIGGTTVAS